MTFKPIIISGICKCGHSWENHHLGMIMNKEVYASLKNFATPTFPLGHPPYIPQECEYYGSNEMGGRDKDGNDHCHGYVDKAYKMAG